MAEGPGKYDDLCTMVRERAKATAAIVIIIGGNRGSGFSVQSHEALSRADLASLLETIAREARQPK